MKRKKCRRKSAGFNLYLARFEFSTQFKFKKELVKFCKDYDVKPLYVMGATGDGNSHLLYDQETNKLFRRR